VIPSLPCIPLLNSHLDFLEAEGCGIYQGYLYGEPLPLADIVRLAREAPLSALP
jgi:EAL domain-containing protein (putative c-di-GMP-specific phosphodiesterase class I)